MGEIHAFKFLFLGEMYFCVGNKWNGI